MLPGAGRAERHRPRAGDGVHAREEVVDGGGRDVPGPRARREVFSEGRPGEVLREGVGGVGREGGGERGRGRVKWSGSGVNDVEWSGVSE